MDTERWQKIAHLYEQALECEPAARDAWLDQACKDDPDLRREVETLLAQDQAPGLMDRPMWEAASRLLDDAPALTPGEFLGHYRIEGLVGAGGMGQVFRAADPRLNRAVAIKILPSSVAIDPQFRERFGREAQAVAALTHPHICTLHDVGQHDGVDFLVMEYLDGETLAACLERGRLPLQRALRCAIEIASALDHAHRHGTVHRDVKPANIMLTSAGVKLMDFGVAKVRRTPGTEGGHGTLTEEGAILGTIRYMSPEQLEGKGADHRSDIFSFGAVVYEMVTGQPAFTGSSAASTMAAILEHEPPAMATLQQLTPPLVDHIVRRCLAKNVLERWQSAGDVMRELKWLVDSHHAEASGSGSAGSPPPRTRSSARRLLPWAAAAVLAVTSALMLVLWAPWTPPAAPASPVRFRIDAPVAQAILSSVSSNRLLAISPDGTDLTYVSGSGAERVRTLILHPLERLEGEPLSGTANAQAPFFSPDGKTLGFFDTATMEMKRVPIAGGAPRTLCKLDDTVSAASWGSNDVVVFATRRTATGLMSVPAEGGQATVLTKPDPSQNEVDHVFPSVLPGGKQVLFTVTRSGRSGLSDLALLDLDSGRYSTLITGAGTAEYLEPGHVVYASGGTLYGVRFDAAKRRTIGDPIALQREIAVERGTNAAQYVVSRTGTLVYIPASAVEIAAARSLVWVDRRGIEEPIAAPARTYHSLRLSPDGMRVALDIRDEEADTWVFDFRRPSLQRVTFTPRNNPFPVWTPDGRSIVTGDGPGLARWPADGSGVAETLSSSDHSQFPQAFTRDGGTLVLTDGYPGNNDLSTLTLDGKGERRPLLATPFTEGPADLSQDGRWIAYQQSDGVGRREIYISPFPDASSRRELVAPGRQPVWARDGRELFYIADSGMLTSVPISASPELSMGTPVPLFSTKPYFSAVQGRSYDVWPGRQRFLFIKEAPGADRNLPGNAAGGSLVVVLSWIEELKARVPRN